MYSVASRSSIAFLLQLLSLLFLIVHTESGIASAQDLDNGAIFGRVMDQAGSLIVGARITALKVATNESRSVSSDGQGRFQLIQLSPGDYRLTVSQEGFASQELHELFLTSGEVRQLSIKLFPEDVIVAPVVVLSETDSVDTSRIVVGESIQRSALDSLPSINRSPLDLIFTLPGVTEEPLSTRDLAEDRNINYATTPEEAGIFALSGGPAYSNNITIDGLDNNDDRSARERFQPSPEAVDEVQVITNQFSAEYGRASGGRVNIQTRSGNLEYRGRAFFFFRDESLNANTFRNNFLGLKRLPLQEHDPGFTFSGPIAPRMKQPRVFFFVSYEFRNLIDHTLIDTLVPVKQNPSFPLPLPRFVEGRRLEQASLPAASAEVAPFISTVNTPSQGHTVSARIDHHLSELHTGTFLAQVGRLSDLRQFAGGNRLVESFQGKQKATHSFAYSDTFVGSANLVNQFRVQFSNLAPALKTIGSHGPVVLVAINDPLTSDDPANRSGTLIAGASTSGASDRREERFQSQEILAYAWTNHSFKVGFDLQKISSTFIDLTDSSGTFNFASAGDFLASKPSRYRQDFLTTSTQRNTYVGMFFQDEWKPSSSLLISYGLRYERESILNDTNNLGPRLGIAWSPHKSAKMVIRAGAGVFYNRVLLRTVDDFTLGGQRLSFDTNSLVDPLSHRLLNAEERAAFIAANLRFPETLSVESPLVRRFATADLNFSRRIDKSLRIPESYQANIGFERDLGKGFLVEANLTFNRGIHLWREFNANAPVLPVNYKDFSSYLASRDFTNFRSSNDGSRPLYNPATAGDLVRFGFASSDPMNPNAVGHVNESGVGVSLINLNSISSTTAIDVALAALNSLRPDPAREQIEELTAAGNSTYRGLGIELRKRYSKIAKGIAVDFHAAYTLSKLIDDGIVNTSDALTPGNFAAERARSLLDRRHRISFSGSFDLPKLLGHLRFSPVFRVASGAPFNISLGGIDRNLDDVANDRPSFHGDVKLLRWRAPGTPLDPAILKLFELPTIGQTGNLPRNAGRGPGIFVFDLNVTREFQLHDRFRFRPSLELDNVLNKTVFSFGSEFINFALLSPNATPEQRQNYANSFLVATRTLRQRQLRVGIRLDF